MKTNNLKHRISINNNTTNAVINIRLNDECKNGHQDFAITGTFYEPNKVRSERNLITSGCCHDAILEALPEMSLFVRLHLCDYSGSPTHATANGFYHLKRMGSKEFIKYFNISIEQYKQLLTAEDVKHFTYLIKKANIRTTWLKMAKQGIKTLEKLTQNEFLNDSKKSQFIDLTKDEQKEIQQKIRSGFYLPEEIENRKQQAIKDKKEKTIKDLKENAKKEIEKINKKLNVKLYVLSQGYSIENVIYYDHTNKLTFNWLDYKEQIKETEFNYFVENANFEKLPNGITFELANVKQYAPTK
jgi:hypothetical protein